MDIGWGEFGVLGVGEKLELVDDVGFMVVGVDDCVGVVVEVCWIVGGFV